MAETQPGAPRRRTLSVEDYVAGVRAGDRTILSRAITLIESRNPEHHKLAQALLQQLLPHTGGAHRVGITGVPGVGKSTFIEALGKNLTADGHKVAVLAVDPSSSRSGGSILGDKTRMGELSVDPGAYIRPSPSAGTLGGVTRVTRESMLVCEAAGFDVVLIETVGAGQNETEVAQMVDFFLVLMLPGAGDELQGIKKGVLELADMIAVNKADGENEIKAKLAARDYASALHIMKPASPTWHPPCITISAIKNLGLENLWGHIQSHRQKLEKTGELAEKRARQQVRWMWTQVEDRLLSALRHHPDVVGALPNLEQKVANGEITAGFAADEILEAFGLNPLDDED